MNMLNIPLPLFRRLMTELGGGNRGRAFMRVGRQGIGNDRILLAREVVAFIPPEDGVPSGPLLQATLVRTPPRLGSGKLPPNIQGELFLGDGPLRGHVWGVAATGPGSSGPFDLIRLPGPGMHWIRPETGLPSEQPIAWDARGLRLQNPDSFALIGVGSSLSGGSPFGSIPLVSVN